MPCNGFIFLTLFKPRYILVKRLFPKYFYWDNWGFYFIYAPLGIVWIYYAFRARSFWFFSPVNPSLIFSGFEGGRKQIMYSHLPKWSYPTTIIVKPDYSLNDIKNAMRSAQLSFPVAIKPDKGMQGVLFRIIDNDDDLMNYHKKFNGHYVLQTFVDLEFEFTVFHIRYPGEEKGKITGFILKDYLQVTGDGKRTLAQLI